MYRLRLPLLAMLVGLAQPATASDLGYDLLVVACGGGNPCAKIAERTLPGGHANVGEFDQDGLRIQIQATVIRSDAVDARISLAFRPAENIAVAWRSGTARPLHRVQITVEPCTLKQGAFRSITSFINEGTTYQVWARLAALP